MQRGKYFKIILLGPALIILAATAAYPLGFTFAMSFRNWQLAKSFTPQDFIGFDHYVRAFTDDIFLNSLKVTLEFVALSVPTSILLGLAMALILQRPTNLNRFVRILLILPFAVAPALKGYSWRFMLDPGYGIFDQMIDFLFPVLKDIVWLQEPFWALTALAITEIWGWAPLIALVFVGALGVIDPEIPDAARVDGANDWQVFRHVTLPLLRPIIMLMTLLRIIYSLRLFDQVATLTGGGPGRSTETLNFFIYRTGFRFLDIGYASALAYILMAILFVVTFLYVKALMRDPQNDS